MDPDQWFYWRIGGTAVALMVGAGVYYFWIREPDAIIYKSGQIPMTKVSRRYKRTPKGIVTFVEPHLQIPLCLAEKTSLSHNVRKFRFALPSAHHVAGLEACQHVRVSAEINGKPVARPYTPVSDDDLVGFVDIVVKIYGKTEKFPNGGALSQYLDSLCVGDKINFRGPVYQHIYHGNGQFSTGHTDAKNPEKIRYAHFKRISLIAGGTGITPILQIMNKSLKDPSDKTEFALLFGNQTQDDILLKNELDEIHEKHPSRFRVTHILSQPIPDQPWGGLTGYITADPIRRTLFPVDPNTAFVICGPPPMREKAVLPALKELGVDKHHIFVM